MYPEILYLEVTEKDIKKSLSNLANNDVGHVFPNMWSRKCPISTAFTRLFPDVEVSTVSEIRVCSGPDEGVKYESYDGDIVNYVLEVDKAIERGRTEDIKPAKFKLRLDKPVRY